MAHQAGIELLTQSTREQIDEERLPLLGVSTWVRLGNNGSSQYYWVPNVYALETWEKTNPSAVTELESYDKFPSITALRTAMEDQSREVATAPSTKELVERAEPEIMAAQAAIMDVVYEVLRKNRISEARATSITDEIDDRTDLSVFRNKIEAERNNQMDEALFKLFMLNTLDSDPNEEIEALTAYYYSCKYSPYTFEVTDEEVHEPRQKYTQQHCIDSLKIWLELIEEYDTEGVVDAEVVLIADTLIQEHENKFRPVV